MKPEFEKYKHLMEKKGVLDIKGENPNPLNGRPFSPLYSHIAENGAPNLNIKNPGGGWAHYVIFKDRKRVFKALINHQAVIVVSGTGTGKTVVFPKLFSHFFNYKMPIIITIPTRKAVGSNAEYASKCMDVEYKYEVSMRTGEDNHEEDPDRTKLLYATDGFVSGLISSDTLLTKFGGIIIDEAHTRGVNIDILLRKVTEICKYRPDFRIMVMSATIDPDVFLDYFKLHKIPTKLLEYPGVPNHPVEHIFSPIEIPVMNIQGEPMLNKIIDLLKTTKEENILAFVVSGNSGRKNKKKLQAILDKDYKNYDDIPWIGIIEGTSGEEDKKKCLGAIKTKDITPGPYGQYKRRVIFATPAIEFSVTFEDELNHVIESGIGLIVKYDYELNCTTMDTNFVYKSNIHQRCGRTGRKGPGNCYRLYTEKKYDSLGEFEQPAITKSELFSDIISIMFMSNVRTYKNCSEYLDSMITPITQIQKKLLFRMLIEHNIIKLDGTLSRIGNYLNFLQVSKLNFMQKKMIMMSFYFNCQKEMLILVSVLANINRIDEIFLDIDKDLLEGKGNEKRKQEEMMKYNYIKKFCSSSGDHMTLYNIYYETLKLKMGGKEKERKQFCRENNIKYKIIEKIDETYTDLVLDRTEENTKNYLKLLPIILYGNFFKVKNHPIYKKKIDAVLLDAYKNPHAYEEAINLEGGGINLKQIQFKGKTKKKKNNKKFQSKKKPKAIKKDFKKLKEVLNKITLRGQLDHKKDLELSEDSSKNVLACLLYCNITKIGIKCDSMSNYLINHTPDTEIQMFNTLTTLNLYKGKPQFIIYEKLTYSVMMKQTTASIISKVDPEIINMVIDNKI
jgi:superfamily II DNA/RNA helicase